MSKSPADRRTSAREAACLPGRILTTSRGSNRKNEVTVVDNLSVRGLFIETEMDLAIGDTVEFSVDMPSSGGSLMRAEGIVRWKRTRPTTGVGIEFVRFF